MNARFYLVLLLTVFFMGGCAMPQSGPAVNPNFVFTPPTSAKATKNSMSIAILLPESKGSFFTTYRSVSEAEATINDFLRAYQIDLEKVIIAKGFSTSGSYASYDEMTFSQKERSSLIMKSEISFNIVAERSFQGSKATVSGSVAIEFLEPMSKEKVWIKHFDLPATTQDVDLHVAFDSNGHLAKNPDGTLRYTLASNSRNSLLNDFYARAFARIWEQLDSREISSLKADADKLKKRTNYRAN